MDMIDRAIELRLVSSRSVSRKAGICLQSGPEQCEHCFYTCIVLEHTLLNVGSYTRQFFLNRSLNKTVYDYVR